LTADTTCSHGYTCTFVYKANPLADKTLGANKRIGCIFLNPSMRTRLSTQIAAQNLGMEAIVFNVGSEGWALEFEEEAIMSGTYGGTRKRCCTGFRKIFRYTGYPYFPFFEKPGR
jgi:N-succinyl-L-ornithine transcarbamylase